ncbi:MAG: DUF4238 domain-containing protein [Acidimicrobiales bacterium]
MSDDLSPALRSMLPDLAEDGGRGRAEILERILADPDGFRAHIDDIDAALGQASPGKTRLRRMLRMAEQAISPSSKRVKVQHYVSQVVLRRFVETLEAGRVLTRYDLATGVTDQIGTKGVAYMEHFVAVDSRATEKLWQKVENALGPAIDVALRRAVPKPAQRSTLQDAVALHLVRNPQTITAHVTAFETAAARQMELLIDTPFAEEAFRRHTGGLVAAGPEARRIGIQKAQGRLRDIEMSGGLFRLTVERLYEKVCDRFKGRGLAILTPASPSREFLLGDVPAVTYNTTTGAAGLAEGVVVDQADEIVMPLAPGLLVAIGPPDGARSISDAEVDHYNRLQVRAARDFVMYRPSGTHLAAQMAIWRR